MWKMKKQSGITLVALIVTVIILIILATISMNVVFGEQGIIKQAQDAKRLKEESLRGEEDSLNDVLGEYSNSMAGDSFTNGIGGSSSGGEEPGGDTNTIETPTPPTTEVPKGPNGNQLVSSITDTNHDTIEGEDDKGNKVVVPGGFKIAEDSGSTVEEGIVVEDGEGNQFVWIPVSNVNHDGSNKIKKNDGTEVEITLGRYTFNKSTGEETKVQYGEEYEQKLMAESYYWEPYNAPINGVTDMKGFVDSVSDYQGFYIGRYMAGQGSGSKFGVGEDEEFYRPISKINQIWKPISPRNAFDVAKQMYYGNNYIESDLINSYMYDTTILYVQAMLSVNFAGEEPWGSEGAASNCRIATFGWSYGEMTTERCTYTSTSYTYPYTTRGGTMGRKRSCVCPQTFRKSC